MRAVYMAALVSACTMLVTAAPPADIKYVGLAGNVEVVGLHFDVEPHALGPAWAANTTTIATGFLDLLSQASPAWQSQSSLPITWDLPVWYDTVVLTYKGETRKMSELVIDRMPRVGLMDFRDEYTRLVSDADDEAAYAQQTGKQFVLAVETQNMTDSPHISFWDLGPQKMKETLLQVDAHYKPKSMWGGVIIHDYHALQIMPNSANGFPYPAAELRVFLYIWQWQIAHAKSERRKLWAYIQGSAFKVHTLLFESEDLLKSNPGILQSFVNEAAQQGYKVELTMGFSKWALPEYHAYVMNMIQYTAAFVKGNVAPIEPSENLPDGLEVGGTTLPDPPPLPSSYKGPAAATTTAAPPVSSDVAVTQTSAAASTTANPVTSQLPAVSIPAVVTSQASTRRDTTSTAAPATSTANARSPSSSSHAQQPLGTSPAVTDDIQASNSASGASSVHFAFVATACAFFASIAIFL